MESNRTTGAIEKGPSIFALSLYAGKVMCIYAMEVLVNRCKTVCYHRVFHRKTLGFFGRPGGSTETRIVIGRARRKCCALT